MPDGAGGFFLFLFESFAARAVLGSLVAALLVSFLLRRNAVRSVASRRGLLLTPFLVAAALAVVSINRGFLPVLQVGDAGRQPAAEASGGSAGPMLDVLGDIEIIGGTVDLLVAAYLLVVAVLLVRRAAGVVVADRMRVRSPLASPGLRSRALRMALLTGIDPPEIRVRRGCPGGALTAGVRRPWIALDPDLASGLDDREIDALLAHEMAHIRRRDPLLGLVTGVGRDLLFFLPGIHLAVFWLKREQEEEADDLAAQCTRRPAALASTILKVWDAQTARLRLANACSAVTVAPQRRLLPSLRGTRTPEQPHVLVRVQRLITPFGRGETEPRREVGVPLAVLALAGLLGIMVPAALTQMVGDHGVLLRVFSAPPANAVESPAFATFRALAPSAVQRPTAAPASTAPNVDPLCPCVESPADLRAGRSAATTSQRSQLVWSNDGRDAWELQGIHEKARLRVNRELLSWHGASQQVGFFTVSRNPTVR